MKKKQGKTNFSNEKRKNSYGFQTEFGVVGQKKYAGVFMEEFLPQLQGQKGIEAYREMSENDDIIGAMLFAIEMLIRQAPWDVEAQGSTESDKEAAQFVKSCLDDMQQSWQDTLSEILSFLVYGWSFHEICYKRRMGKKGKKAYHSKYEDGLIGWKKLPIRAQDTLYRWEYDQEDELVGMSQMAPPDYTIRTIPIEKAIHFVTKSRKWSPEGRSILRNAYRQYYFKRRFQEIEGIGVERDLAGLPFIQPPEGVDIWDGSNPEMTHLLSMCENLVKNIRRDAKEGIVLPYGWTFSLLNGGSKRQFEIGSIIERCDTRMAMTAMADFVLLGHQQTGSFALSSDKTTLFSVALGTYLNIICDAFNTQAIPRLIELNQGHFPGLTAMPKLIHGDVEQTNLAEFAAFIEKMTGAGVIESDENLERYVRKVGNLPEPMRGKGEFSGLERKEL